MRNVIIAVVLLLAVGAFFAQRHRQGEIDPAVFLPADSLVYIDQRQAGERGKRFLASPLGKAIASIDVPGLLRDLDAPADAQVSLKKMLADFKDFTENKITVELLADRFVVAVLPRRDWMKESGVLPDARRQLVLLCKPQHGATAIDLLASIYSGDLETETVPYGKYSLKRFKNEKLSFVACVVDGWLVAAFEERALRETLDTFDAGANSLAVSEDFKKMVANLPQVEQIVYLRLDSLVGLAKDSLAHVPESADKAGLAEGLNSVAGFDGLAYGSRMRDGILEERYLVSFVPEKTTAAMRKFLSAPAREDGILPHLRDNLLFYSYTGVTDWSALGDVPKENRATFAGFSGHSVDEVQKMLGDGASRLFMRKGESGQSLPLPFVNFCVETTDAAKLDETAAAILTRSGVEMTKGKFQDASYQVWNKAPEKSLRLYSALWRGQWCLGNSLDFLKEIAESAPAGQSLLAAKDFKAVDDGIAQPAQSFAYIRIDQSLELLRDACGWFATVLAVKDRELSVKAKLINERVVFPLLEGAKMYRRSLGRGVVVGNLLRVDGKTSVAPPESK